MVQVYIKRFAGALFCVGAVLFLSMLSLTVLNIALRAGGESLRGCVELSGYLGAAALGLCLPWVQLKQAHAEVGVRFEHLSSSMRAVQQCFVHILCLAITVACAVELYDLTLFVHEGMETVDGWNIASALFVAALTLGIAGQSVVLVLQCVHLVQKLSVRIPRVRLLRMYMAKQRQFAMSKGR